MPFKHLLLSGLLSIAMIGCGRVDDPSLDLADADPAIDPVPATSDLSTAEDPPTSTPHQTKVNTVTLQAIHVVIENLTTTPDRAARLDGDQFVGILPSTSRFKDTRNDTMTIPCSHHEGTVQLHTSGIVDTDSADSVIEAEYQNCRTDIRTRTIDASRCIYHAHITGKITCTFQGAATGTTEVHIAAQCQTDTPCGGLTVVVDDVSHTYGTDMTAIYTKRENALFLHNAFPRTGQACIDDLSLPFPQWGEVSNLDTEAVGCEADTETTDG